MTDWNWKEIKHKTEYQLRLNFLMKCKYLGTKKNLALILFLTAA